MKTLLLLRHGKAEGGSQSADYERALTRRGERQSVAVGERLGAENLVPQRIVTSTAERALATAKLAAEACGYTHKLHETPDLYLADPQKLLDLVCKLPDKHARIMLVGHNPGLEDFVAALTGIADPMGTAHLAVVQLDIDSWSDATADAQHHRTHFCPSQI